MLLKLSSWGNSLGLRIPKEFREGLGLSDGSEVRIYEEKNKLVIEPLTPQDYSNRINLKEMMKDYDESARHEIIDDDPVGREVW